MKPASLLKFAQLACLSKPAGERSLYRAIRRVKAANIVEIGLGDGVRTERVLQVARRYQLGGLVRYTGIDLFDARDEGQPGLTLREAHRMLAGDGVKAKLVPGDPFCALARAANSLTETDLLLIASEVDQEAMQRAWTYVPRMLHDASVVLVEEEQASGNVWRQLTVQDVQQQAGSDTPVRRAA